MSFWAEDPELFLHKGQSGVVHLLRCKKETATSSSSSSMLMKPEDFTDEGVVTDLRSLTGTGSYVWDKNKYEALMDYIYPRHLLVNCHGSVIVELEPDEKNKKADAVVYMRALDILDMGTYGPGPDYPGQAVPVRTIKYLQDGTIVQTEPTANEMKLSKEVEALQQELLEAKEKTAAELAKEMELTKELAVESKELETSEQELLQAKEKIGVEIAKETKLTEELAIKSKEVETLQQELQLAKEQIEVELAKENKLTEELAKKSEEIKTLQQELLMLLKVNTVRIYSKAATNCSLTIRNGHVILGSNNEFDVCQYWVKDDKYGATVTDVCGLPSYALVNKFTGQALKPSIEHVELVPYNPNVLDPSILWSEHKQGDGYRAIRKDTDISLNMDAFVSNGVVGDGTIVGLGKWFAGKSQLRWNIVPYC